MCIRQAPFATRTGNPNSINDVSISHRGSPLDQKQKINVDDAFGARR
jgi:hypothetical protein